MATKKDTVRIHNKDYETVASRVARFREDHPEWAIIPEVFTDAEQPNLVMVKTTIKNENDRILSVGHAEETRGSTQINRTSALENCETSSVGRALALLGYAGTELASADEVANAISQQADPQFHTGYLDDAARELTGAITDKQISLIELKRNQLKTSDPEGYTMFGEWYKTEYENKPFKNLTKQQASVIIDKLKGE